MEKSFITSETHGGKVTCHKCNGFILDDGHAFPYYGDGEDHVVAWFHTEHYNPYEHYYGLDKPID